MYIDGIQVFKLCSIPIGIVDTMSQIDLSISIVRRHVLNKLSMNNDKTEAIMIAKKGGQFRIYQNNSQ